MDDNRIYINYSFDPWIAFGFALFIGIFFGLYPAMKAAKMSPVDALRYE